MPRDITYRDDKAERFHSRMRDVIRHERTANDCRCWSCQPIQPIATTPQVWIELNGEQVLVTPSGNIIAHRAPKQAWIEPDGTLVLMMGDRNGLL